MYEHEGFFKAAEEGDIKRVQDYISKGIDVNLKDDMGESAIYKAAEKGHVDR